MENVTHRWYILFPNHHQGLRLNQELKQAGIRNQIAPTPRAASSCCGISLIVAPEDLEKIQSIIAARGVIIEGVVELPVKTDWQYRGI